MACQHNSHLPEVTNNAQEEEKLQRSIFDYKRDNINNWYCAIFLPLQNRRLALNAVVIYITVGMIF